MIPLGVVEGVVGPSGPGANRKTAHLPKPPDDWLRRCGARRCFTLMMSWEPGERRRSVAPVGGNARAQAVISDHDQATITSAEGPRVTLRTRE